MHTLPALLLAALPARADTAGPAGFPSWDAPPADEDVAEVPAGAASLSATRLPVHAKVTVDWIYTAGEGGLSPGDGLRIEDPLLHGMRWSKYGAPGLSAAACTPLADEGASVSLVTASAEGEVVLGLARNREDPELCAYAYTDVQVEEGQLLAGQQLRVRFGDASANPDCGQQTPYRAFTGVAWRGFEFRDGAFAALDPSPTFDVVADPAPAALHAVAPSFAVAGEPFVLRLALLDTFGNPVPGADLAGAVGATWGGAALTFGPDSPGWRTVELTVAEPGVERVEVTVGDLAATANPVVVLADALDRRLFWGDLHAHHGHTAASADGASVDENQAYARDVAGIDVGCESMKLPPAVIDGERLWEELRATCAAATGDGRYLDLLGFEWMGGEHEVGHHNVHFDDCEGFLADQEDFGDLGGEAGLLARVAAWEEEAGGRAVVLPHASVFTGYDWDTLDPQHRTSAEVFSGWGDSLDPGVDGSVADGLARGQMLAFHASSDDHDGWLGNPRSAGGAPAGLTAFWAPALTRADVFAALAGRRTYATTGARVVLDLWTEVGGARGEPGGWVVTDAPRLAWEVHGSDAIARVAVRGVPVEPGAAAQDLWVGEPGALDIAGDWAMEGWRRGEMALWLQVDQADGQRAWSSPIWVTADCARPERQDPAGLCDADPAPDEGCRGCASAPGDGALAGILAAGWLSCRRPSRAGRRRSR